MRRTATAAERRHMGLVANMPCVACQVRGHDGTPAEVHHVRVHHGWGRSSHYATIPLCAHCHRLGRFAVHNCGREEFAQYHGMSELMMLALVHARMHLIDGYTIEGG